MKWLTALALTVIATLTHATVTPKEQALNQYVESLKAHPKALYRFLNAMPKGGELHYHLAGGAYPEVMIQLAKEHHFCINPTTYTLTTTPPCLDLARLLKNHRQYQELLRAWSMIDFKKNKTSAHDHFYEIFYKTIPAEAQFRPALLASTLKDAAKQHELYLEIMVLLDDGRSAQFANKLHHSKTLQEKRAILLSTPDFQKTIKNTVNASHQLLKQTREMLQCEQHDAPACNITVKFQYFVLREQNNDAAFAQALHGFEAALRSDDIVGVNLVQAEDGPLALAHYHDQMTMFQFLHRLYPQVHISLHAGELAQHVGLTQSNDLTFHIHDAITTGHAERIGHGVDVSYETQNFSIMKMMAEKNIPVEINLTSNQTLLHVKNHPFLTYLKHDVPVVLSTDDEGILRTHLTNEYMKAMMQYGINYHTLKMINRNTLTYSFLSGKSLWHDSQRAIRVKACHKLHSESCLKFIKNNEKARLQWTLESQLLQFESLWLDRVPKS